MITTPQERTTLDSRLTVGEIGNVRAEATRLAFQTLRESHAHQLRELAARVELELDHVTEDYHCLLLNERDALIAGARALEAKETNR